MKAKAECTIIHFENTYASGQKKRPRGPRPVKMAELTSQLTPLLHPRIDLNTQATAYYLGCHLQPLTNSSCISQSVSDDLMPIWKSKAESSMLNLAVSSLALAVFSRTQRHQPAAIEASMNYQKLLQIAHVAFLSLDEGNIDTCLLAIFLMGRYEDVIYQPSESHPKAPLAKTLRSFSHHDGGLAILKLWRENLSHGHPATNVIKHTRRGMIRSALLRNLAVPEWMVEGSHFGECGLELRYDRIVVRIANFRKRLSSLLENIATSQQQSNDVIPTAEKLNNEAQDIDEALEDWKANFPSIWSYQKHNLSDPHPWPMRDFYSPTVYSYSDPAYAAVWIHYYAMRMLVNNTRLETLRLNRPGSPVSWEQQLKCLYHMRLMANDLASSIPYCLQRFKVSDTRNSNARSDTVMLNLDEDIKPYMANLAVWPLSIASSLGGLEGKQRSWFRSELARLGRIIGVSVIECAETTQWLEL